jgi:membrane-associated phospholipid phosphatase
LATRASRIRSSHAHTLPIVHAHAGRSDVSTPTTPGEPSPGVPPRDPGVRRSLRRRLAGGALARAVGRADVQLYRLVRSVALPPGVMRWVRRFSAAGEHAAVWLAFGSAAAVVDRERRRRWMLATEAVAAAHLLNTAFKVVVRRRRPALEDLPALVATPTELSFPSAHATSSFAAARAFSSFVPPGPLYAAAGAMALSRVYLGVHYPSDVVVGAAIGTVVGSRGR